MFNKKILNVGKNVPNTIQKKKQIFRSFEELPLQQNLQLFHHIIMKLSNEFQYLKLLKNSNKFQRSKVLFSPYKSGSSYVLKYLMQRKHKSGRYLRKTITMYVWINI